MPFALIEKVEANLTKLVDDGILLPTRTSAWASPIVVVGKNDDSVRCCTMYSVLIKLSYRIYEVKLSESSQNVCSINTHKGLYKYTRMPFGVQSAPAIFQSIVDQILLNTKGIAYMDDIG